MSQAQTDSIIAFPYRNRDVELIVRKPKNDSTTGTVILLHGWNHHPLRWCNETTLCDSLLSRGFCVLMPNFGKTTYQEDHYPETRKDYLDYPDRLWMRDTFFRQLSQIPGLLDSTKTNFIAGISTGGRGAALLGLDFQEYFSGIILLSSDFDQSLLPNDPIYNGHYGSFSSFPERWLGNDNIQNRFQEFKIPLFIAHGKSDKICDSRHSEIFYQTIIDYDNHPKISTYFDKGGHNYAFWETCTPKIMEFISFLMRK